MLSGRNEQVLHTRADLVFAVDMEVWGEDGRRHRLPRHRAGGDFPLAWLPFPRATKVRRSISFDRSPAVVPLDALPHRPG